jgi:Uncharacterized protein conserved in bacteria (DUF2188)
VNAHYTIQRKGKFWLLSREDKRCDLAFFNTKQQAIQRAEALAFQVMPSQLSIYHESGWIEERHYPKMTQRNTTPPLHEHVL